MIGRWFDHIRHSLVWRTVVFANIDGFWDPLFELFEHTIEAKFTPANFRAAWVSVDSIEKVMPALTDPAAA